MTGFVAMLQCTWFRLWPKLRKGRKQSATRKSSARDERVAAHWDSDSWRSPRTTSILFKLFHDGCADDIKQHQKMRLLFPKTRSRDTFDYWSQKLMYPLSRRSSCQSVSLSVLVKGSRTNRLLTLTFMSFVFVVTCSNELDPPTGEVAR